MKKFLSFLMMAVFSASLFAATYTVAGSSSAAFGTSWDPENKANDMTLVDGVYTLVKEDVTLAASTIEYKVCKDHAWTTCYPSGDNAKLSIPAAGKYNLTFTFVESTGTVNATAQKTEEAQVDPKVSIKGGWDGWAEAKEFTLASDKKSATLVMPVASAATYEFKVIVGDGDWRSNEHVFTRDNASSANITGNSNTNMKLTADVAGEYTFVWTFASNTLVVTFPEKGGDDPVTPPTPVDSMTVYFYNGLGWANVNAFVWGSASYKDWPGEAAKKEAEKINDVDVYAYTFPASYANVIFNNGEVQTADLEWDATKPYFVPGDKNGEGKYTGTWYAKADIPTDEPVTPPTPTLASGFYLVGSMTGWAPKEGYLFAANPDKEGEYQLTVTLAENDEFKVTYAEEGVNKDWFPSTPDNFVVTDKYVGEKTIYFNPNYQQDWAAFGGYFFLAENEDQPAAEWAEIIFTAATAADATAKPFNDSVFTVAGSTFSMKCSDAQGKMAVDANNATFGTKADGNTKYTLRLKTMGKTGSSNFMTLTIPADGILRFAALPGGTSDERTVVMKQGDDEIYNQVITSNKNEDNYYDYRTVNVKQGTLTLTYPVNGINFYSFAFKAAEPEQPAEDEREKREIVLVPGGLKEADPAMFLMAWTAGKEGFTTKMDVKEVEGDTLYVAQMPKELDSLIFVRCATGAASIEWGVNVWNQSADQKIACDTATFAGWNDAMFNVTWCAAEPEQPGEDEREKREIVLVPGGLKEADPAMFLMAWTAGKEGFTTKMDVKKVGEDTLYVAQMPKELDSLIFVRCATGAASIEWGVNVWNQSTDQKIACDTATFAGWNDAMFNVTWCAAEPEQPTVAKGYYLVGTMNNWTPAADYQFAANPDKEGEYQLTVTLAENDEFKVAYAEDGVNKDWFPSTGDNFVVTDKYVGEKTIYFNASYQEEWAAFGGYFYLAENEDQPAEEWAEIVWTEAAAADAIAEDATYTAEGTEFVLTLYDAGNKMAIDANDCRFGTAEAYKMYRYRIKTGGASSSTKNYFTLNIPEAGTLRIAPRTGSNAATDRKLVIEQGENELYNQVVQESQAVEVQEGENTVKVYPYVDVAVAAGSVRISYTAGLNFYTFAFKADKPEQPEEDLREKREVVLVPGELKTADPSMIIFAWTAGKEAYNAKMAVKKVGEDTLYTVQVPKELDSLIFVRAASGVESWSALVWEGEGKNVWNQSADQKIACDTATFAGWNDAMFNVTWCAAEPEQPEEDLREKREVVLVPGELKTADPSMIIFAWTAGKEAYNAKMAVKKVGEDTLYTVQVPKELDSLIFVRAASGVESWSALVWEGEGKNVWNQSADQKIACDTATFAGWNDAMFNVTWCAAEPEQPEEDLREKREVVLVPGELKTADPSMIIFAWTAGKEAYNAKMAVKKVGEDTLYTVQVPKELDSLIFVRAASGVESWSALVWEGEGKNVWNQSADQKIACDTATFAGWNDAMFNVTWCAAEPEQPAEDLREKREVVLVPGELKTADPSMIIFAWTAGKEAYNAKMAVKKVGEDTLYTVQVPKELDSLIFVRAASGVESWSALVWEGEGKNVWNQSADQKIACDTATFAGWNDAMFNVTWCATEPEQPEEDLREKREVVLVPGELKTADPSMIIFAWTAGKEAYNAKMAVKKVGEDTLYTVQVPKELDSLIFVRAASGVESWSALVWEGEGKNVWNQSADQKIACDTATFAGWNDAMFNVTWCATEPEQPTIADGFYFVGTANNWTPAAEGKLEKNPDNEAEYMFTTTLAKDDQFKVVYVENGANKDWYGMTPTEENPDGNYIVDENHAGEKTIYFNPAGNTEWGGTIYVAPNGDQPIEPGELVDITLVPGVWNIDGAKFAAVTLNKVPEGTFDMTSVIAQATFSEWFVASSTIEGAYVGKIPADTKIIAFGRFAPETEIPNLEAVMSAANFWNHSDMLEIDASMKYTIDGWPAEGKDYCPGHWGDLPTIADGFYFVGTANEWTPAEGYMFSKNPDNAGEYMVTTTLAEGDQFKIVYVENGEKKTWYGAEATLENPDGNYIVDANHAGEKTIYFRPEGNTEWGGCFYIAPNEGTGFEEIIATGKAAKYIRNGQFFIIKGDKMYNVTGAKIR